MSIKITANGCKLQKISLDTACINFYFIKGIIV